MDYSKLKSTNQKWLEIGLLLAILILVIGFLIFTGFDDKKEATKVVGEGGAEEKKSFWKFLAAVVPYIVIIVLAYFLYNNNKANFTQRTYNEVIELLAKEVFSTKDIYLNTKFTNVKVERGNPNETYCEFLNEHITYLYAEGVGVVEIFPGQSIRNIKKGKQEDKIQMKLAEIGIAKKKHIEMLDSYNLTEEEK